MDGAPHLGLTWNDWRPRDSRLLAGFEHWQAGRLSEAEAFFSDMHHTRDPDVRRALGSVLWSQKRFLAARRQFQLALALDPWNPMHWSNLGLALRDLRCLHSASMAFEVATGIDPGYEPAWNEWGNVFYDMRRPADALERYDEALRLYGGRAVVHHNRGMSLLALGRTAEAETSFLRALEIDSAYDFSITELRRLRDGFGR